MNEKKPSQRPFEIHEVADYRKKRYRGLDQKLVDRREKKLVRRLLGRSRGERMVLDMPCGYGRFSETILRASPTVLISADLSEAMVRAAMDPPPQTGRQQGIVCNAKQGLPFKTGSLDGVVSLRFFHHLHGKEDRLAVLSEFARVTKSWIVLSYYRSNALHVLQRKLRRRIKKSRTRIKMLKKDEFMREIGDADLAVTRQYPLFRGLHAQHFLGLEKKRTNPEPP